MHFVLIFLIFTHAYAAPTEGACEGGYKEGQYVNQGAQWSECKNGRLVPKGCLTANEERLRLQDTFDIGSIRAQCTLNDQGIPILINKSCIQDGREHQVDETWDDTKYMYKCKKDGDRISIQAVGCIRNGDKALAIGARMIIGEVVYECKWVPNSTPTFTPWGCAKDGNQYAAGEQFDEGQYWYTCNLNNGVISLETSGCVNEKVRFQDGDHYFKDDIIYECVVKSNEGHPKVVGCMQLEPKSGLKVERRTGCTWTEGDETLQVTMTCKANQEKLTATPVPLRCNYKMPRSTIYSIEIGCYRIFEDVAVGCSKDSTGHVKPIKLEMKNGDVAKNEGLNYC